MKRSKKKIGIVRGFPRVTQLEYASSFVRLEPVLITPSYNVDAADEKGELEDYCKKVKLERRVLKMRDVYRVDPVKWVLGRQTHQSWIEMKGLEEIGRDLDVIETHELYLFDSGQAAKVAKKLGIPLVTEVWTTLAEHLAYKLPPYSWVAKRVINQTDLFVARSKRAKKALLKLGVDEEKIRTIYYGVNLKRFYPRRTKREDKEKRVLFVGVLEKFKGVDKLLDVWKRVVKQEPKARLWLVGEGSLLKRAEQVKGVRVLGKVGHTKLGGIYRQADVFVSPSQDTYLGPFKWWEEYFSHVLMEAQACGLPIVATRCGGIPEEIGDNNWLVEQKDKEGLVKALVEVLGDRKKREKVGRENRKRAERLYDLEKQVEKLERELAGSGVFSFI